MLGHRHQLDMGVTHFEDVRQERFRQLEIAQRTIAFLSLSPPRTEMNFVNAERTGVQLPARPRLHPLAVVPLITIEIVNE